MGNITGDSAVWEANIRQHEAGEDIVGGPDGEANIPSRQLSSRTKWLKEQLESLATTVSGKAATVHTHLMTSITGLADEFANHVHAIAKITGLQAALDGKAALGHTHLQSDITDMPTFFPAGSVIEFAGAVVPAGWLNCDGSAVSRATYAALYGAIGVTYGQGDGASTFNLPDFRGRCPVGAGSGQGLTSRALGATGGAETVTLSTAQIPAHNHINGSYDRLLKMDGTNTSTGGSTVDSVNLLGNEPNIQYSAAIQSAGGGEAHANMQPWLGVMFLIKT